MKKNNLRLLLTMVLIVLIAVSFSSRAETTKAQTIAISGDAALELALSYSMDDGLMGGRLTLPEKVYGEVMTYDEAVQFVSNRPIDPNTKKYEMRNKLVWLIVLEGKFVEYVPSSPDGAIPATEILHNQMAIILDGKTGEIMREILVSPQRKLPVTNLPVLQKSNSAASELPTRNPILTEIPYPTLVPSLNEIIKEVVTPIPTEIVTPTP
ncbi:MAG: hypothetical protein FJZ86_15250 [Chloroflexi bacterium]|nr:hypothetical protein [Chloroflexota bacterium]